jgi:hypothetical protein
MPIAKRATVKPYPGSNDAKQADKKGKKQQ